MYTLAVQWHSALALWTISGLGPQEDFSIQPHTSNGLIQFNFLNHLVGTLLLMNRLPKKRVTMEELACLLGMGICNEYISPGRTFGSHSIISDALNCLLGFYNTRHLAKVEIGYTSLQKGSLVSLLVSLIQLLRYMEY